MADEDKQQIVDKKRTFDHMMAYELQGRLRSKHDFYKYLDKQ